MKIIRISTRIYPDSGGPAKQAFLLSKYCAKNNLDVINIACIPKNKKYVDKEIINENFTIYYLPFHAPGYNSNLITLLIFFIKFFIYSTLKIYKITRNTKINLIHAHTPLPSGFIAYFFYKLMKIPYFYTLHGLDIPTPFLLYFDFLLTIKNAQKNFTVSRSLANYLIQNYNVKNVVPLPNGIEISSFRSVSNSLDQKRNIIEELNLQQTLSPNDKIISYIGYMILPQKVKGMVDFLRGFNGFLSELHQKVEQNRYKLLYIGDGEFSYRLKEKVHDFNLEHNVFLLGKRNDVKELLSVSDLLGLTSYIEGFPNVLLEAMASKVPCLVSNVGDMKFIVNDTGYIIKPGAIREIRENLKYFFSQSDEEVDRLKEKAFQRVKNKFNINAISKKLIRFYQLTMN